MLGSIRRLAAALLLAALSPAGLSEAHAHAVLMDSVPSDRQVLPEAPGRVELRFNEPVDVRALRLIGPDGAAIALRPDANGPPDRAVAALPPLGRGTHVLSWRLVSADGHPVAGSLVFSVGAPGASAPAEETAVAPLLAAAHGVARALAYAATLFASGTVLFLLLFGRSPAVDRSALRRPAVAAVAVAGLATLAVAALQAAMLGVGGWADLALLLIPAASVVRLLGLAAVAAGLAWRRALPLGGCGALAVAVSYPLTGHTAPIGQPWLSALLGFHLLAAAFWLGALWPLIHASRHANRQEAARLLAGFSRVAMLLVPALVLAGLVVAWQLAGGWAALWSSAYGAALLVKTAAVTAMLGLAAWNKLRLVPAFRRNAAAGRRLRRSIAGEAALALLVLAATAGLTSLPPPGHGAADEDAHHHHQAAGPVTARATTGPLSLDLAVSPGRAGENAVELALSGADGVRRDLLSVTLRIGNPALGVEDITRPMWRVGTGLYRLEGPEFASAGRWRITAELLVSDFEKRIAVMEIEVPPFDPHRSAVAAPPRP